MDATHAFDQLEATTRDLSPLMWIYYERLKKEGFSDAQALYLVRDFQNILFRAGGSKE